MRGVERSQSLRDSPSSLRPKVSFNRAVHIKRISGKERLPRLVEDEGSPEYGSKMAANGIKSPSKFSTLPSRSAQRNGVKKPETPAPSDRLSRLIRHDPKAEETPPKTLPPSQKQKKKTLGERVKGIFSRRKQENQDDLKARYTEFKGRNSSSDATDNEGDQYSGKRRGSAPESTNSWFRSLERLKKPENGRRTERYFGESDSRDSTSHRRGRMNDSSADSEAEGMGSRAPSLVYLHTAAVGDIPHRRTETPSRRLSRSVSVLAPWAPKLRPPRPSKQPTRTRATQTDMGEEPVIIPITRPNPQARSLPKLVFTGPSIEETVSGRSTTSTIQRSTVHLRSRK